MPIYQFKCDKCEHWFEESIFLDGKDPPDYYKCPKCKNRKAPREYWVPGKEPNGFAKGNTDVNRRRHQRIVNYGMDKSMADNFYRESIAASKERMSTMGEVYKEVVPDVKQHIKQGLVKVNDDKTRVETVEKYKKIGAKHLDIKSGNTKK